MKFIGYGIGLVIAGAAAWLYFANIDNSLSGARAVASLDTVVALQNGTDYDNRFGIRLVATSMRDGHAVIDLRTSEAGGGSKLYKLGSVLYLPLASGDLSPWSLEQVGVRRVVLRGEQDNRVMLVQQSESGEPSFVQIISSQPKSDDVPSVNVVVQ